MKTISKLIPASLMFIFFINYAYSQSSQNFTFSPANTLDKIYNANEFAFDFIDIVNLTGGSLRFKWKKISNTFNSGWDYSICDLGRCYPDVPDSSTMDPTSPGGDAYFICHMSFNNIVGSGELKLFVYEAGDEASGDTVTFRYTTNTTSGVEETQISQSGISVYPNPANEVINVNIQNNHQIETIEVFDITGKLVYQEVFRLAV